MVERPDELLIVRVGISVLVLGGLSRLSLTGQYETCGLGGHRVTLSSPLRYGRDTSLRTRTVLSERKLSTQVHSLCSEWPGRVLAQSRGTMRPSIPPTLEPRRRKPSDPVSEDGTVHLCLGRPQHSALKLLAPLYLDPTQPN